MKAIALFFSLAASMLAAFGQNCDIAHTGVAIYNTSNTSPVASVATGQLVSFRFSIANMGTDVSCAIPAYSVTAVFKLPVSADGTKPYVYDGPATFSSGYFTWSYYSTENVLRGTNMTAIPNGTGDKDILVPVRGVAAGAGNCTLKLAQANGTADNTANDVSSTELKVTASPPLPVKLATFTVVPDKCNAVLNWTTASEETGFSHFDIEYSTDGITFILIGKVKAKAQRAGAAYGFTYFQVSGNGYYRLKQMDKDGKFEYSPTVRTVTSCTEKGKVLVYPNPLNYQQKLSVNISGYAGAIKGELFDALGQKINSYVLVNGKNELSVMSLSSGTYTLYVRNNGSEQSFKLVVTR